MPTIRWVAAMRAAVAHARARVTFPSQRADADYSLLRDGAQIFLARRGERCSTRRA